MATPDTIIQLSKMVKNLGRWLDKAAEHAKARGFEPNVYLAARLAPDQYPLVKQVQAACDAAKFAAARLSGKEAPKHPDTETTFEEIRARVEAVATYLDGFNAKDFDKGDERMVPLGFMPGKGVLGKDYLEEMAVPNFYFHLAHSYAILRHNGVDLGKTDFIGSLNLRDL